MQEFAAAFYAYFCMICYENFVAAGTCVSEHSFWRRDVIALHFFYFALTEYTFFHGLFPVEAVVAFCAYVGMFQLLSMFVVFEKLAGR